MMYRSTKIVQMLRLIERIQGARVVVTKELPVSADLLSQFPDTVEAYRRSRYWL